jgi:hypothetical protein
LQKLYNSYNFFLNEIGSFIGKIHDSHKNKFVKEYEKWPDHQLDLQKMKSFLVDLIRSKLEKLSVLIFLKIYSVDSIENVEIKLKDYENLLLNRMKTETELFVNRNKIKSLKKGENFKLVIESDHQYADFIKLSNEEMMDKFKLIVEDGIETYGLANYSKKLPCYSCQLICPISGFWHHDDKSRYSYDYICKDCKCSVHYEYDWSGPWD